MCVTDKWVTTNPGLWTGLDWTMDWTQLWTHKEDTETVFYSAVSATKFM